MRLEALGGTGNFLPVPEGELLKTGPLMRGSGEKCYLGEAWWDEGFAGLGGRLEGHFQGLAAGS